MITSGGPYQTNPAMISKIRDLAAIVNRIGGIQKLNSEMRRLQDSVSEASPPMRRRPKVREGRPHVIAPEQEHNPVITGLHNPKNRQRHRMRTPGSTGAGFGGIRAPGAGVGAHIT